MRDAFLIAFLINREFITVFVVRSRKRKQAAFGREKEFARVVFYESKKKGRECVNVKPTKLDA